MKINKPRIGIFSDLHLGVHSNSSEWHNYAVEWAHWFKEECKRKNIKDLISRIEHIQDMNDSVIENAIKSMYKSAKADEMSRLCIYQKKIKWLLDLKN